MQWERDEHGERWPVYTEEEAQRIARAAWGVHFLLPHPDDVNDAEYAENLRRFNRALTGLPERK
jgi:hypothetical protein